MVGCLSRGLKGLELESSDGTVYSLEGDTEPLGTHVGEEVGVRGRKDENAKTIDVMESKEISKTPLPRLSAAFSNTSAWIPRANPRYGVRLSGPPGEGGMPSGGAQTEVASKITEPFSAFPGADSVVIVAGLGIPRETYAGANFTGGAVAIIVDDGIKDVEACAKFDTTPEPTLSSLTIGNIRYAAAESYSGSMSHLDQFYYFHSLQYGRCYEIAIALGTSSTAPEVFACMIPQVSDEDQQNLIRRILDGVSFYPSSPAP